MDKSWPYPDFDCRYYLFFASNNILPESREFLIHNPPPQYWLGGPWAWAHAVMPDILGVNFNLEKE